MDIWLCLHLANDDKKHSQTWDKTYEKPLIDHAIMIIVMGTKHIQLYNKIQHDIISTKSNDLLWYEQKQLSI